MRSPFRHKQRGDVLTIAGVEVHSVVAVAAIVIVTHHRHPRNP
jgi:hypothetical protein